jgi:hypothetical protein
VAEGGGLLNRCTGQNLYPGFESLPLRQLPARESIVRGILDPNLMLNSAVLLSPQAEPDCSEGEQS